MKNTVNIFWFRRDLRLDDNVGLHNALKEKIPVLAIFIFDTEILDKLPKNDARVAFICETLTSINTYLKKNHNSGISMFNNTPLKTFEELNKTFDVNCVYTNQDYEPYAIKRDNTIASYLKQNDIDFKSYKDQVIFEKNDIVKNDNTPYKVYTPFMKKWKERLKTINLNIVDSSSLLNNLYKNQNASVLKLSNIGFTIPNFKTPSYKLTKTLIQQYENTRNFPSLDSTSKLGPHLRFGTVSIRKIVNTAMAEQNEIFLQELIWREFFMQILWHFPHTEKQSFKPKYDRITWRNDEKEFKTWCEGKTGYPLVDAGMRQLNATGFMHNRVRMLVGSFLCKHLLIDWRWGEAYFAEKLLDYDMASNVGNWQWVAGCGVDAAPYFRIFNPTTQIKKFDKDLEYIKQWAPDFQELTYPTPIVEHKFARERCLATYKEALT